MGLINKLILIFTSFLSIAHSQERFQLGAEKNDSLTGPSQRWVKSALKEVELEQKYGNDVRGIGKSQLFLRYTQTDIPYLIGSIHFHSFPYSNHPENDTPEAVKAAFLKMHQLKNLWQRKIDEQTWVFQTPPKWGPRFIRVYFTRGKKGYAISTAILRNAYIDSTEAESEWLQLRMMERHRKEENEGKTTHVNFDSLPWSVFPKAHAEGPVVPCPPVSNLAAPAIGTCPQASSCSGLLPPAQAVCLNNISNCQQNNLSNAFSSSNNATNGFRSDLNCQSNNWGSRIDNIQSWAANRLGEIRPQFDKAIQVVDKLTDPVHMAGVAALGAMATVVAGNAIALVSQGIGEGISYLYKELSGKNEEEIMKIRADNFEKAKKQWENLNGDLVKVEEAIDTSVEIIEVIKASGLGLEDFIQSTQDALKIKNIESSKLKFEVAKFQKLYEKTNNEEIRSCAVEADLAKADIDNEIQRLIALSQKLSSFKKKSGTFELACKNISSEIGKLLVKEAVIEKERVAMGLFFAAHLWVEQKDAEKLNAEKRALLPMESNNVEMESAKKEFYNRLFPVLVNPEKRREINCREVLMKLAENCYEERTKGTSGIPILGIIIDPFLGKKNTIKEFNNCAVGNIQAHHRPTTDSAIKRSVTPNEYSYFLGVYAKELLASGKVWEKVGGEFNGQCVKSAVNGYSAYTDRMIQIKNNFAVDLATWNQRNIGATSSYRENSAIINQLKVESACSTIADSGCLPEESACLKLQKESCSVEQGRIYCAQHIPGSCPGPSSACKNKKDDTSYCKYQFESIERCQNNEKDCVKNNFPMDCEKHYDNSCNKSCEKIVLKCKSFKTLKMNSFEECNKRFAPQIANCEQEEKECFLLKSNCVKSSYSNAKFRFEKFRTMRKYLDENLCNFPKKSTNKK